MNYLKLMSEFRQREKHILANVGQYWTDRLVEKMQAQHHNHVLVTGKVLAVLDGPMGRIVIPGLNVVTNSGDLYYAQSAAGETPTDDFDAAASGLRLGDSNTAPTKSDTDVTNFLAGTGHALDATYEKTNDGDADNTGAAVDTVTWRYSYLTSEGNAVGIEEGAIVDNRTTPTDALTHFLFAALFDKTSSDTLKVFVNHNMLGV